MERVSILFKNSPLILISFITCFWFLLRGVVYQFTRFWFFDIPVMIGSPVSPEHSISSTALILLVVGVLSATIGIFRKKEKFRYWGFISLPLNLIACNWVIGLVIWAIAPPPGIDY